MGTIVFMVILTVLLVVYDLWIRAQYYFSAEPHLAMFNNVQTEFFGRAIRLAHRFAGLRVVVERPPDQSLKSPFIIISNHQSLADIPILVWAFPRHILRFVAKRELKFGIPTFSFSMRKGGFAFVDRKGDFRSSRRQMYMLAGLVAKHGICPAIFPEGTRSRTGKVMRFHSAALRLILEKAQLPVLSVALDGGYRISKVRDMLRNLSTCVYRVRVLTLYPCPRDRSSILKTLDLCRQEINRQVEEWQNDKS